MKQHAIQKQIHRYLKDRQKAMVTLTRDLCAIPTENPPGKNFKDIAGFLAQEMRSIGFSTRVIRTPKAYQKRHAPPETQAYPRYNVLARWDCGAEKTLHFNSHFDVVPVNEDWTTDPFRAVLKRGRMYARGTSDMKGCIASCIFAVKAIKELHLQPRWNLECSFTADEEIGGQCGAGYLLKEKIVRPDAAVICEGGSSDTIMIGHRGVLWVDIAVQGRSAHGANPDAGINAFENGMDLVKRIRQYHQQCQSRITDHVMDRPNARRPSLTIGGVSGGGTKVNTIPSDFHFTLDRRLIPEERCKEVVGELREILKEASRQDKTLKAKLQVLTGFDAAVTDAQSSIGQAAQHAVETVLGKIPKPRVFGAFTDLHFFTHYARCPAVGYGVEGDGIHGSKEYLVVRSLVDTARVYADMALSIQ